MRVLALEPYYGGSHKAFLDGWVARSRHGWTLLSLPAHHWKWRMRHAAATFAQQLRARTEGGQRWDCLLGSDMLNLAEFLGLAPQSVRSLPAVAYFHENQLNYPVRREGERDLHFSLSNMVTALAATQVWFNSAFHRDAFLAELDATLRKIPKGLGFDAVGQIRARSLVEAPGIDPPAARGPRAPGPLRILWAARWEHDKGPEEFFDAVGRLDACGVDFRLSVIGEQYRDRPAVFDRARDRFAGRIDRWGFQPARQDYHAALAEADVIVSTAAHEFFGLSVVEAIAAGAYPLLPKRLAYPEVLGLADLPERGVFFYEGGAEAISDKLEKLATHLAAGDLWQGAPSLGPQVADRFFWTNRAAAMDEALEGACRAP